MQDEIRRGAADLDDDERSYAISLHERQESLVQEYRSAAINVSNVLIRALLTLNGGAAIAFATIVAAMVSRSEIYTNGISALLWPLIFFACGAGLSVFTGFLAYLTHSADGAAAASYRYTWDHPYLAPMQKCSLSTRRARLFNWTGVIVGLASLAAFFVGVSSLGRSLLILAET